MSSKYRIQTYSFGVPVFPVDLPRLDAPRPSAEETLARNVGLLSGIPDADGGLCWVCEYDEITLRDLARGAPQTGPPSRLPRVKPSSLMPSTMNTFKPDTKAAGFLAGSNELLSEFEISLRAALRAVDAANRPGGSKKPSLEPVVILACWAAGVLSGYRSYPLLFVSSLKARAIQRVLANGWVVAVPADLDAAPAEYGGHPTSQDNPRSPTGFGVLDHTLDMAAGWLRLDLSPNIASLTDSIANAFGRILIRVGGPREGEPAIVWAHESRPGRRSIDVLLPPLRVIKSFIGEQSGARLPRPEKKEGEDRAPDPPPNTVVPLLPDAASWAGMGDAQRKLLVEMYTLVLRWLRDDDVYLEEGPVGRAALQTLDELTEIAARYLPADDPVRLDCAMAAATGAVRGSVRGQEDVDVTRVIDLVRIVRNRLETSADDVGLLLDVLSRGAAGLNRARRGAAARIESERLTPEIHECWRVYNAVLAARVPRVPGASALGYHLHNYAGFLGTLDDVSSLREAVDLARRFVVPSRRVAYDASPRGNMLRFAYQVAARSASRLAVRLEGPAFRDEALAAAELGLGWAKDALSTENAKQMLAAEKKPVDGNVLFASAIVGAFAAAASLGIAIESEWLGSLEQAVARSHEWVAGGARGADRVAQDGELEAQLEVIRSAASA